MNDTDTQGAQVGLETLANQTIEDLMIGYRRIEPAKRGTEFRTHYLALEAYLIEARKRDAELTALRAEVEALQAQLAEAKAWEPINQSQEWEFIELLKDIGETPEGYLVMRRVVSESAQETEGTNEA